MNHSYLIPNFYIHPDYLAVDQVLDQIGKHIIRDWDNSHIKASKIVHKIIVSDAENRQHHLYGIETAYLTPLQEVALHERLNNPEDKYAPIVSGAPAFLTEFLREGYIGQSYFKFIPVEQFEQTFKAHLEEWGLRHNQCNPVLPEERTRSTGYVQHVFSNVAFLINAVSNFHENAFSCASRFEIILGSIGFGRTSVDHEDDRRNINNLFNLTKVRNSLRNALVAGELCSYLEQGGQYEVVQPDVWGSEKGWWRLLIEGFKIKIVRDAQCSHFSKKKVLSEGRVLFKKSEVNAFLAGSTQFGSCPDDALGHKEFLEKLFDPKKPWLKLLNELALVLSPEEIETKTKKELMRIIEQKAKSCGLTVTPQKLEHLATFLRCLEQEKGKA